jgi:hypothetical protein
MKYLAYIFKFLILNITKLFLNVKLRNIVKLIN